MIFNAYDNNSNLDPYLNELLSVAFEYETIVEIEETDTGAYLWSSRSVNGLKVKVDRVGPQASCFRDVEGTYLYTSWCDFYISDEQDPETGNNIFVAASDSHVCFSDGVRLVIKEMKILEHLALYLSKINSHGLNVKGLPEGPNTLEVESFSQGYREWIEFGVSQIEENSNRICLNYRGNSKKAKEILVGAFGDLVDEDRVVM